jgi:hypothetical protein
MMYTAIYVLDNTAVVFIRSVLVPS